MGSLLVFALQLATLLGGIWLLVALPEAAIRRRYPWSRLNLALLPFGPNDGLEAVDVPAFERFRRRYRVLLILLVLSGIFQSTV